jgi:hypothetical protein
MAGFNVNLTGMKPEDLDGGAYLPAGWYKATVSDVAEDNESAATVITYQVLGGKHDGRTIKDRITNPNYQDDDKKRELSVRRAAMMAKRLGILTDEQISQGDVDLEFNNAMGREVLIHVESRKYTDKSGNEKEAIGLTFDGVYPLVAPIHDKVPDAVIAEFGLPPRPAKPKATRGGKVAAAAASTQAAPAVDLSNL